MSKLAIRSEKKGRSSLKERLGGTSGMPMLALTPNTLAGAGEALYPAFPKVRTLVLAEGRAGLPRSLDGGRHGYLLQDTRCALRDKATLYCARGTRTEVQTRKHPLTGRQSS